MAKYSASDFENKSTKPEEGRYSATDFEGGNIQQAVATKIRTAGEISKGNQKDALLEKQMHTEPTTKAPIFSGIDDVAQAKAEKFGVKQVGANPFQTPQFDNTVNSFMAGLQTKQSGTQPIDVRKDFKTPSQEVLKSPMTQFASGAYEGSNIARSVSALQKMSGQEPLMSKLARETQPYKSGFRTAGSLYSGAIENAALYGSVGKAAEGLKGIESIKSPLLRNIAGQQLGDTLIQTPGVIMQGIADKKSVGEIAKDVGVQQAQDLAGNLFFYGAGKVLGKLSDALKKPVSELAESTEIIPLQKISQDAPTVKSSTLQGKYKAKNTAYENVVNEYNEAIEAIQNHFRTNELRTNEIPLIKSELGIDLDDIINRMEIAEKGVQLPDSDTMRLKRAAGVASDRAYNLADNVRSQARMASPLDNVDDVAKQADPLGGKLPKSEPKPLGGEFPKEKASSGIPVGEKPLSFPQTVAKSDLAADELKQMIKDNPLSHQPINNLDTLKYAQEIVDQNFEAAKRIVKEGDTFQNATESAMAQDVIRRLQNNKQWDEAFEVMEATARKAKTSGQTIQAFSMWRRMTPEGMLRYADKVMKETGTKMTGEFADKLTEAMKRIEVATDEGQLRNAIMRQAGEMPEWAYKSMSGKTADQLKDIAMAQVLSDIADQVPKSAWKKLSTVQAMSHLINIKTAARNVLGNLSFGTAEKISNAIAVPFDAFGSLFTKRRTLTMPKVKGTFKAGFDKAKEAAFDASMGLDRTGVSAGKYNVPTGSIFKGKLGKAGEKALKYELNVPDEFFKGQVYEDVLRQQMSAAKVTEATQEMMEYATKRAAYATFQDDSLPARILQGVKDVLNNIGGGARKVGKSGIKTREFGVGDLIIKYTTVPGNLISRSVEYTPAGLFKILSIAKDANLSGAMKQSEISMAIGRAITGTSMIAMGAALRRKGLIISEDKDRGRNAQSLDQAEGLGNYKVNVSAVERLLDGGDATPQDGDLLYSYNWIEPLGVQIAIGAEIDKEMQKQGALPEIAFNAGNAAMEEILDIPTLSVIRQMTYQDNAFDIAITPFVQGASGFVPSPIRQYAQYQDPTARLTKGSTPLEGAFNRVKSALPSVNIGGINFEGRKGLEPKIDTFGREVKYPGGTFNNFINPGQASTYKPSEVTPQLKQLEDLTGQTDFYPRDSAPFSFTHNKQPVVLTPQDKTVYMQIEGQEVLRLYKEILVKGVNTSNAEQQRKALNNAKEKASKMAREEVLKRKGLK